MTKLKVVAGYGKLSVEVQSSMVWPGSCLISSSIFLHGQTQSRMTLQCACRSMPCVTCIEFSWTPKENSEDLLHWICQLSSKINGCWSNIINNNPLTYTKNFKIQEINITKFQFKQHSHQGSLPNDAIMKCQCRKDDFTILQRVRGTLLTMY